MNLTTPRPCAPRARCHQFRTCPICARIRQAKIADAAERLASRHPDLTWTCLSPTDYGPRALAAARDAFLRAEGPPGALWTVELSPQTGAIHCNIIHPSTKPRTVRLAKVWQSPIQGDPRAVAAYIAKREQMPDTLTYPGRLYGTAGPLWQWLSTGTGIPIIEAAKAQYDLDIAPLAADTGISRERFATAADHTWADYRAIAAKRLADIMRSTPLYGHARPPDAAATMPNTTSQTFYRPVLNSRRNRWLTGTLYAWEKSWRPKSPR